MADDILTRIDDTLTDASACFCGCQRPIAARSASPWFASEECQVRWNVRRITSKDGIEEVTEPAEAATPPATWTTNHDPRSIGCRNCGSWLAVRAPLCGPCSALPSCSATRWAAVWGGTARCLLPYGHADPEHWSVEGRTWTDRVYVAPPPVEALRPGAEVTIATPDEAAAHARTMETRSLECSRAHPMCSGCDGAAAWGWSPCLHDCHEDPLLDVEDSAGDLLGADDPLLADVLTALEATSKRATAPRLPWWNWKRWTR